MRKAVLAVVMAAVAGIFALEMSMEQMFTSRRQAAAAQTMAEEPVEAEESTEIYALFGIDSPEGDAGRSDCILLLSLDGDVLRMCSLARDTMVTLPGADGETKLGHAYAVGGPEKALETLQACFGVEVTSYAAFNFSQMAEIVELMGGVEVPLSRAEWTYLGLPEPYLGSRRLNGQEALRYCRIRAIDNDDMRTGRQRTLIAALLTALQDMPRSGLPRLAARGLTMCRTNMGLEDVLRLGGEVLARKGQIQVEELAIPGDAVSAWGGIRDDGVWYYVYDLDRAAEVVDAFFHGAPAQTVEGAL